MIKTNIIRNLKKHIKEIMNQVLNLLMNRMHKFFELIMLNYHGKLMNVCIKSIIKAILVMIFAIQNKLSYQQLNHLRNQNQKYLAKENNSKKL